MKKILYTLVIASLAFAFYGCEKADNLANSGDNSPVVTVYNYAVPDEYDDAGAVYARAIGNPLCSQFYVLAELVASKESYIAANGESAYAQKVVSEGEAYLGDGAAQEVVVTNLYNTYAVTFVPVSASGVFGEAREIVFEGVNDGVNWQWLGKAAVTSGAAWPAASVGGPMASKVSVYRNTDDSYELKLGGPIRSLYPIRLKYNDEGVLTILNGTLHSSGAYDVPTGFLNTTYGMAFYRIDADPEYSYYDISGKKLVLNMRAAVSAGAFVDWHDVVFDLDLD